MAALRNAAALQRSAPALQNPALPSRGCALPSHCYAMHCRSSAVQGFAAAPHCVALPPPRIAPHCPSAALPCRCCVPLGLGQRVRKASEAPVTPLTNPLEPSKAQYLLDKLLADNDLAFLHYAEDFKLK